MRKGGGGGGAEKCSGGIFWGGKIPTRTFLGFLCGAE